MTKALYEFKFTEYQLDAQQISFDRLSSSRGLMYGLGVFETLVVHQGRILLESLHYKRLEKGALAFNISFDISVAHRQVSLFLKQLSSEYQQGILKIYLYSGDEILSGYQYVKAPRGYAGNMSSGFFLLEWSQFQLKQAVSHIKAIGLQQPMTAWYPDYVGLKMTASKEYVAWSNQVAKAGFDQGLIYDADGFLVESNMSNVVLLTEAGEFVTPALNSCGVHGVLRQALIDSGIVNISNYLTEKDVLDAKRVYLINSVRGAQSLKLYQLRDTEITDCRSWNLELQNPQASQFEQNINRIMYSA